MLLMFRWNRAGFLARFPVLPNAVLDPSVGLRKWGFDVEMLPVNTAGFVEPVEVAARNFVCAISKGIHRYRARYDGCLRFRRANCCGRRVRNRRSNYG